MKLIYILTIICSITLCGCKKTSIRLSEQLVKPENGWKMQSMSIYSSYIDDLLNSSLFLKYKDVGELVFLDNENGIYTYMESEFLFTWSMTEKQLYIDIENKEEYESPFIYYYFAGNYGSPFTSDPEQYLVRYSIEMINNYTMQMRYTSGGLSSYQKFGDFEIILTKND